MLVTTASRLSTTLAAVVVVAVVVAAAADITLFGRQKAAITKLLYTQRENLQRSNNNNNSNSNSNSSGSSGDFYIEQLKPFLYTLSTDINNSSQLYNATYEPSETVIEAPDKISCRHKPIHWSITTPHAGTLLFANMSRLRQFQHPANGTAKQYTWLQAKNICQRHCMQALDFNDQIKWTFFKLITENITREVVWTSGRVCDFAGCKLGDKEYMNTYGWFWSDSRTSLSPTNSTPLGYTEQPWFGGNEKVPPQPDKDSEHKICLAGIKSPLYPGSPNWFGLQCQRRGTVICQTTDRDLAQHEQLS